MPTIKTLAQFRDEKELSQKGLAEKLTKMYKKKFSTSAIAMWETGARTPGLKKAKMIAKFFGVKVEDIIFGPNAHSKRAG